MTLAVHKWLNILYTALKFLICWPSREEVCATLPECFCAEFLNAVVIIDCTDVFIEWPSNLLARSQTWSTYKSHNTIKYLFDITPQGTISSVSKAWGGQVSDKVITDQCGILSKLLPRDLVLADQGLEIQYRSDSRYKFNAFIASDERVYCYQRTHLTLMTNAFIAEGKRV